VRKVYWRPRQVSSAMLALVALMSIAGLASVEVFQVRTKQRFHREKLAAAGLARDAMAVIKNERMQRAPAIDEETDPAQTGLLGLVMSEITTSVGHLPSKQTSVNPNFAAVMVHMLKRAGVDEGDTIAAGLSGSWPALNISVYAAAQTLKLNLMVISSVTGSQWGANDPEFTWLDMERILAERRVFSFRSLAASPGGIEDKALGLGREERLLVFDAIERNGRHPLKPKDYHESVERRMQLFRDHSRGAPIGAYVNVGGGTASVGTRLGKRLFKPGLNRVAPPKTTPYASVMARFVDEGIPVIHMVKIISLAERYGLQIQPVVMPAVGEGKIYVKEEHSVVLTLAVLLAILFSLYAFVRTDMGFRFLRSPREKARSKHPEQMV
jgi:poly-gamma-glutamate system protein